MRRVFLYKLVYLSVVILRLEQTQKRTLHFCRWSRKNYAIFQGLGHHIVIGHLNVDICEASTLKSGRATTCIYDSQLASEPNNASTEESSPPLPTTITTVVSLTTSSKSDVAPRHLNYLNTTINATTHNVSLTLLYTYISTH